MIYEALIQLHNTFLGLIHYGYDGMMILEKLGHDVVGVQQLID